MSVVKKPRSLRFEAHLVTSCLAVASVMSVAGVAQAEEIAAADPTAPVTVVITGERADNPNTDPAAPYRVRQSASELLVEPIHDTAKSVQALPKDLLDDMGLSSFRDIFRTQPGITLGTGEGGNAFGDRVFIRGFDARNDVYVDGVRDPGVGSREIFATDQIEIMKGPSSSFGGRGTTGGAISLVSKQARTSNAGDIEVGLGSQDTRRVTADFNRVLTDKLTVRLNVMDTTGGVAGRDHVYNDRSGVALAVRYAPTDRLVLKADYFHLASDYLPDWGLPWDSVSNAPSRISRSNYYGLKNRDFGKTGTDIYTLQGDYALGDQVRLHSVTRYGKTLNRYLVSAPGAGITTLTQALKDNPTTVTSAKVGESVVRVSSPSRDQLTDYATHQTYLTTRFYTGPLAHTLVSGFELSQERTRMVGYSFLECGSGTCTVLGGGTAPTVYQSLNHPDFNLAWPADGRTPANRTAIRTTTAALFAIDSIHIGEHWIATVGARQDHYATVRTAISYNATPAALPVASKSDFLSYNLGLLYRPTPALSLYVNQSTSKNPPCEQLDATAADYGGCTPQTYATDPIDNRALEAGAKYLLGGHLDLTAAVFRIDRRNVPTVISNTLYSEDQRVSGVELSFAGNITPLWSVFGGLTLMNSETVAGTNPADSNVGKAFPNVPDNSATLTSRYQVTKALAVGGTLIAQSEKFGGTISSGATRLPAFERVDLMAEYTFRPNLKLRLNVQNAGDATYYDALYRSAAPYVYVAPGRSVMLTLDWHP